MALIKWGDDEEDTNDLFETPIKQVASVQSGSWQPAPSGADSPQMLGADDQQEQPVQQESYLLSEEKAQKDAEKAQRDAEIAEARRQDSIRQAAANQLAQQQVQEQSQPAQGQPAKYDVNSAKKDTGWKKYYDKEFKREKDGLDFWGRLTDGGQASKRAEVAARNKYNNDLIRRAYDDNGNVRDANAATQATVLTRYNSATSQDNVDRAAALSRAIGATRDSQGSGIFNRLKNAVNAEKQMNLYDAVAGADDSTKFNVNDIGRFGGGLVQGLATMPTVGGKELIESVRGRGTNYETGLEEDLTPLERGGRFVSGGLNVVTPFVGGSGKLLDSLTSKVLKDTATAAERTLLKRLTSQVVMPSIEQGAIGAGQAGAEYFGNGNTLLDENGDFDKNKLLQFAKETGTAGAMGAAGGALLSGGAMGVTRLRNRGDVTPVGRDEIADMETRNTNAAEAQLSNTRAADAEGQALQQLEAGEVPPQQVADGVVTPDNATPINDSNLQFEAPTPIPEGDLPYMQPLETVPVNSPASNPVDMPAPADGIATTMPTEITPIRDPSIEAPAPTTDLAPDITPVPKAPSDTADVTPVANGVVQPVRDQSVTPVSPDDVRALQESRVGKSQADEAVINQQLQEAENTAPSIDNLPDDMTPVDGAVNTDTGVPLTRKEVAERLMPKLADNKDVKQQIANAAGMSKDVESPIRDILSDGRVNPRQAERIATRFEKLEKQLQEYNGLEEMNQRAYAEGGTDALDEGVSRDRSRAAREMGTTTRRLMQDIRNLEGSKDFKTRLINNLTDAIGTRNASVLSSAGLLERNIMQELTANIKLAAKNPIKTARSTFTNGNIIGDTVKSELSHWGDLPSAKKPVEIVKYVVGNTYRTGMIPTTALANTRRGAVRDEFTKWAYQELEGRKVSTSEAHKLAGTAGNELEALVNTFTGVDNGMTNRGQAMDAMKAWKEYVRTGDDGAKSDFMAKVEQHNSLADQMIAGMAKEDQVRARGLMAMKNLIFPFVRTATNLAKNTVRQDINPFAKSLLDEIRADQRGITANTVNTIKSKLVDYGIMGGAAALATSGAIVYNDGDEVDKPKGWSIKIGDDKFVPVRATSLELPIAMAGAAQAMATDISEGKARDWKHYAGMITGSLPYIDQFNTTTGAVDSLMSGEDTGYAAKAYGVNMAKGFVPFSNNGVQAYIAGKQGKSLNAKTVYDKDLKTWFTNTVRKSYDPNFYNSLKDSRDNAGRVRTVDNQGVITNKTINDASTAEFNTRITDLVDYGREAGFGKNTQDMFNTYDTGKNNNFKSVQDAITFLDVENGKPDPAKKLEKNAKLTSLSEQIREGFYGNTGDELLTLGDQTLKSDVSMPNKSGSKNSKMPISMQSIKNAIAQTDISKEDSATLYDISNQSTELYNQLKAKSITYDQYSAAKAGLGQQEVDILSSSKNYKKMEALFDELDESGFFKADGLGSTKSGQTYLWNALNSLLGSKGATPATAYPEDDTKKGFTPWGYGGGGRGTGRGSTNKPGDRGNKGLQWTPVARRQLANVQAGRYTPIDTKIKLNNAVKKDKSQNYSDRSF